jgi:hypothetical protein
MHLPALCKNLLNGNENDAEEEEREHPHSDVDHVISVAGVTDKLMLIL